jgi:hypothetical protein
LSRNPDCLQTTVRGTLPWKDTLNSVFASLEIA